MCKCCYLHFVLILISSLGKLFGVFSLRLWNLKILNSCVSSIIGWSTKLSCSFYIISTSEWNLNCEGTWDIVLKFTDMSQYIENLDNVTAMLTKFWLWHRGPRLGELARENVYINRKFPRSKFIAVLPICSKLI